MGRSINTTMQGTHWGRLKEAVPEEEEVGRLLIFFLMNLSLFPRTV